MRVILCRLPEKGIEERVEEIKERDREERDSGEEVKNLHFQNGHHGSHLGFPIRTILAIFNL